MGFHKNKKEKKKGPKGKRARAKAKLERQWGETVDESQVPQLRHGKSRLVHQQQGKGNKRYAPVESTSKVQHENIEEEMDVGVSSDESDEAEQVVGGALNLLLESIQKKSRDTRKLNDVDDSSSSGDSDSEMSIEQQHGGDDQESDGDDEPAMSDGDDENAEDINGDDNEGSSGDLDPFSFHFNREPLSESELEDAIAASQKMIKASFPGLDSCLEFMVNEEEAQEALPLFACNRKVLQRTWNNVNAPVMRGSNKNKILSPLQSAVYPSLATYKDVLLAAENREVSITRRDSCRE